MLNTAARMTHHVSRITAPSPCAPRPARLAPRASLRTSHSRSGVALVVTLLILSVITFMVVTFLVVSRSQKGSVTTSTDQTIAPGEIGRYTFCSNALPAAVEMELGLLEQYSWDRYNSIPIAAARRAYLQREDISTRVHLFRQRVPIRNVDPLAYQ